MDPDRCLADLLGEARQVISDDGGDEPPTGDQAVEMAASVLALHEWITGGGFLPAAWRVGLSAAEHGAE